MRGVGEMVVEEMGVGEGGEEDGYSAEDVEDFHGGLQGVEGVVHVVGENAYLFCRGRVKPKNEER